MTTRRRQPRLGNRRHVQVYLDETLHERIRQLALLEGVSFSRAARELLKRGAATIKPTESTNVD